MRFYKLLTIAALIFPLAVSLPGFAHAQAAGIIAEFCAETQSLTEDTISDLTRNADDQAECFDDLDGCLRRARNAKKSVRCVNSFTRCTSRFLRDRDQACEEYLRGERDAYRDAARAADRENVEDEVLDSPVTQECLEQAVGVAALCAGIAS